MKILKLTFFIFLFTAQLSLAERVLPTDHVASGISYAPEIEEQLIQMGYQAGALINQGRNQEALEVLNQMLDIAPNDVVIFNMQARCYLALGQPLNAINQGLSALKHYDSNYFSRVILADIHLLLLTGYTDFGRVEKVTVDLLLRTLYHADQYKQLADPFPEIDNWINTIIPEVLEMYPSVEIYEKTVFVNGIDEAADVLIQKAKKGELEFKYDPKLPRDGIEIKLKYESKNRLMSLYFK